MDGSEKEADGQATVRKGAVGWPQVVGVGGMGKWKVQ